MQWALTDAPTGSDQAQPSSRRASSRHCVYAVEIFVFMVVGWGWLSVREYMSATPVLDVSVFVCLLVSSTCNLAFALAYPTTDRFRPFSRAFFAHVLSLWVLYVYVLVDSVYAEGPICCGSSSFSAARTYAAAYFGGLPVHQAAGAVTVAFFSVLLVLAGGQARACSKEDETWISGRVSLSVACLASFHLGLFAIVSNACDAAGLGGALISFATIAWLLLLDVSSLPRVHPLVQRVVELFLAVLTVATGGVLSARLAGSSAAFVLVMTGVALRQALPMALMGVEWGAARRAANAWGTQKTDGLQGRGATQLVEHGDQPGQNERSSSLVSRFRMRHVKVTLPRERRGRAW